MMYGKIIAGLLVISTVIIGIMTSGTPFLFLLGLPLSLSFILENRR